MQPFTRFLGPEAATRTIKKRSPRLRFRIQSPARPAQAAAREPLYQQSPTRLLVTVVVMPWPAMSILLVTVFSVGEV
ncbi:hypothetical protein GCM10027276_01730 [Comamonas piscis]